MNEEALNLSVRKFVKKLGVTAQREIEQAMREAAAGDRLEGALRLWPKQPCRCRLALPIDRDIPIA